MTGAVPAAARETRDGSVLIIAADLTRRARLGRWVAQSGFAPTGVESAEKSAAAMRDGRFDFILLRVLESGRVCRVGGDRLIDVDVRVIAATNRDPAEAVAIGRLRADLYYRLMVFPVVLPPLRSRRDDIGAIAEHYLERLNRGAGTGKAFSESARAKLLHHLWPGNARELRNAINRAFILAPEQITSECLPLRPRGPSARHGETLGIEVGMTMAEAERRLLLATLERAGGNKKRAAEVLGISVKTVYSRLSVYEAGETGEGRRSP